MEIKISVDLKSNTREIFCERLKELREKEKQTQAYAAEKMGLTRSSIGAYESGKRIPDIVTLNIIANYYNVSADYLLGNVNAPSKDKVDVCKQLGISEKSADNIRSITSNGKNINLLLESEELPHIINALINIQNVISIKYYQKYIVGAFATVFKNYDFGDTEITAESINNLDSVSQVNEKLYIFQLLKYALITCSSDSLKKTLSLLSDEEFRDIQESCEFSLTRAINKVFDRIENQEKKTRKPTKARKSFHNKIRKYFEIKIASLKWEKIEGYECKIEFIEDFLNHFDELLENCIPPKNDKKMISKEKEIWQQLTDLDTTDMETS